MPIPSVAVGRTAWSYVPWKALSFFIIMTVGLIVWAVGANVALNRTKDSLADLDVRADGTVDTIHSAATGAVVCCFLMAIVAVLMAGGRTCMLKRVDTEGKAVCGSVLWLAVQALLMVVWWLLMLWMVFVIFGSCLWWGAGYTARGVLKVTVDNAANSNETFVPTNTTGVDCPSTCLNLDYFNSFLKTTPCVCDDVKLKDAYSNADAAVSALEKVVAGAFLMFVGASFILMNTVGDFAETKRERELLLRAQKSAMDMVSNQLAATHYAAKDVQPLLNRNGPPAAPQAGMGSQV